LSLPGLSSVALKEDLEALQQSIAALSISLPPLTSKCYIIVPRSSQFFPLVFPLPILMFLFFPYILRPRAIRRGRARLKFGPSDKFFNLMFSPVMGKTMAALMVMEFAVFSLHGSSRAQAALAYVSMQLSWLAVGFIFQKLRWPNNPLIASIRDVLPPVPADSLTQTTKR
jgi:hypothetical protein